MARRFDGLFFVYVGMLVLPLLLSTWWNADEIATWWHTGTCPGGPMDRKPEPCSVFTVLWLTVLGGWASPIVLSLLLLWCVWWTSIHALLRYLARRRRASPNA